MGRHKRDLRKRKRKRKCYIFKEFLIKEEWTQKSIVRSSSQLNEKYFKSFVVNL